MILIHFVLTLRDLRDPLLQKVFFFSGNAGSRMNIVRLPKTGRQEGVTRVVKLLQSSRVRFTSLILCQLGSFFSSLYQQDLSFSHSSFCSSLRNNHFQYNRIFCCFHNNIVDISYCANSNLVQAIDWSMSFELVAYTFVRSEVILVLKLRHKNYP